MEKIYSVLFKIGALSGCHQLSDRSFFIKGRQIPVCARCTGAFIGQTAGLILYFLFSPPIWLCLLFCLLMFIDWFFQYISFVSSTNFRRLITGILCGYGFISIHIKLILFIVSLIKNIITYITT